MYTYYYPGQKIETAENYDHSVLDHEHRANIALSGCASGADRW